MRKLIVLAAVVVLGAVGLYLALAPSSGDEPEITYVTVPVEKGTLKAEITSSGTVRPVVEVLVGSQVSGTIREMYADFESQVKKGELIALIDPDMFDAKAAQARADLESAKASLEKAEVTAVDEVRTLKRKEGLIEQHSISQSDYDTAKTKADAAVAQVAVDRAKVSQMAAKLRETELQLQYTRIIAPVKGVVTARSMDVGQTVTAGFQTPVLYKIAEDLTRMQVNTNVDEADIGRVQLGQKASFTVPAFPEEYFSASVSQIRNDPKVEQNVVTYNVILEVDNTDLRLRPGMTANVQILLSEVHDAVMVPDQALRFSPPEQVKAKLEIPPLQPGRRRVWKLEDKNRVKPLSVGVGVVGTERVQVLSQELKPGDKVVVDATVKKKGGAPAPAIRFRF